MDMNYDIIIIGSGPGGYSAAARAGELGFSVCVVEKDKIGGVCLNSGCIPTKAFIHNASMIDTVQNGGIAGLEAMEVRPDKSKIITRLNEVIKTSTMGIEYLFKKNNVKVVNGSATIVDKNLVRIGDQVVTAKYMIIAAGSRNKDFASFLTNKNSNGRVITSDEALFMEEIPKSLVVIGGGAIGVEFAYIYKCLGSEVTVLEYFPTLLPNMDEECGKTLERSFKKMGIKVTTSASLTKIDNAAAGNVVHYTKNGKEESISSEYVLAAMGRTPNTDSIGVENIGLSLDKGYIPTDKSMKTAVNNIFAIGDVVARSPALAHVAYDEARTAVEEIAFIEGKIGKPFKIDYNFIPFGVYTEPQVAGFGVSEKNAKEKNPDVKINKLFFKMSGKANAIDKSDGFVKMVINKSDDKIFGAWLVGPDVTELLHEIELAAVRGLTAKDLADVMHAHPTLSEMIKETAAL
jgi:dihydrolipoamide dehydrogenase